MTVKHTLVSLDMRVFALCSLMELHRGQETRTRIKAVYPLRPCQRCRDLRLGADDGSFQYRTGTYFNHYERCRLRNGTADGIAV